MYDYARTAGHDQLKVTKSAPIEFEFGHQKLGHVRVVWSDQGWFAETSDHKVHPLGLSGLTPIVSAHPNAQRLLIERLEKVLDAVG